MWNLDDKTKYTLFLRKSIPYVFTWGDDYRDRRENIRAAMSAGGFPQKPNNKARWAFRITARKKMGAQEFDAENVPKLIVDSFCAQRIRDDGSHFPSLALYEDDTLSNVPLIQVYTSIEGNKDETMIEIFTFGQ
jgi:hypothetical protein